VLIGNLFLDSHNFSIGITLNLYIEQD